jgi:hypothetical protein
MHQNFKIVLYSFWAYVQTVSYGAMQHYTTVNEVDDFIKFIFTVSLGSWIGHLVLLAMDALTEYKNTILTQFMAYLSLFMYFLGLAFAFLFIILNLIFKL